MQNPRTTICGLVAAAAGAVALLPEMPTRVHLCALAAAAVATALLGFFARDAGPTGSVPVKVLVAAAVAAPVVLGIGCAVGSLRATLSSSPFGAFDVLLTGGSIGRATNSQPTNPPPTKVP